MRVLFLCRSLDIGGAERQLVVLARRLRQNGHQVFVAVFYAGRMLEQELREAGVPIVDLRKRGRWDVFPFVWRLIRAVKSVRPDLIYAFLGTPNILSALLRPLLKNIKVVWGVRASNVDLSHYDILARAAYWIECRLSAYADLIICNSKAGLEYAAAKRFPRGKMIVIQNGIDTERFKPDVSARQRVRQEWLVAENEVLIGLVARLDPMKGHPAFLCAAAMLAKERPDARFVCVGEGRDPYRSEQYDLARDRGLDGRLIWAGMRQDMPAVFNALDIASSCSSGEGFSNAIGEAMACGVPCVVTDVGDSAGIVGDRGVVVSAGNPQDLCSGWKRCLEQMPSSESVRDRACGFSVDRMVKETEIALSKLGCH